MNKIYTLEEFKEGKIAINTKTQEEFDNLMRFFDSKEKLWCGVKSYSNDLFIYNREKTCITCDIHLYSCGGKNYGLNHCDKDWYKKEGYKIIKPTELKGYLEFMGKEAIGKLSCVDSVITLSAFTETQLTIGQAIDWMLESEENVVEYEAYGSKWIVRYNTKIKTFEYYDNLLTWEWEELNINSANFEEFLKWKNIKKHIEPKKRTLKDFLRIKEPFAFEGKQYRFNKKGVLMNNNAEPLSLKDIQEILKEVGNE